MRKDKHTVSIIIPTLGRGTLDQSINSLKEQTRKPDEILIIKDKKRKGASWARNKGILKAKGNLIAFFDDDQIAPPHWLEKFVETLDKYKAVGVGSGLRETDPLLKDIRDRKGFMRKDVVDNEGVVGTGGNILFRKSWLLKLKKEDGFIFNPHFAYTGEDWELVWRLRRKGAKLVFTPNYVNHLRKATFLGYIKHQFVGGVGIACLHKAHKAIPTPLSAQKSLMWGKQKNKTRWARKLILTILGPFDVSNFSTFNHYLTFWIGQKARSLGFLWGLRIPLKELNIK